MADLYANGQDSGNTASPRIHDKCPPASMTALNEFLQLDTDNATDSDVTIESADGVRFRLHTQNLKMMTESFPGSEFPTEGEPTKLTENSDVLEVVFAYIYPQRYPSLDKLEFKLLAKIAEAVEKYQVFPAINWCELHMRLSIPKHPDDVLVYAIKHGYVDIVNSAAKALARSPKTSKFIFKFSPVTVLAWTQYSEAWSRLFESAIEVIDSMKLHTSNSISSQRCTIEQGLGADGTVTRWVSHRCHIGLVKWVKNVEKIASLEDLLAATCPLGRRGEPGVKYCNASMPIFQPYEECVHMETISDIIWKGIQEMPTFDRYLEFAEHDINCLM